MYSYCSNDPVDYVDPSGHKRKKNIWQYSKAKYSIKFSKLWNIAEAYRKGKKSFAVVDLAISSAITLIGIKVYAGYMAIAGITYSITAANRKDPNEQFYEKCYKFYDKNDNKNKKIYITEWLKRKKAAPSHKRIASGWKMYNISITAKKPKGFKEAKKK